MAVEATAHGEEIPAMPRDDEDMAGPNKYCNWAVRGRLLVGPFPREAMLSDAVAAGCSVFVCLVSHRELERSGGSYAGKLQRMQPKVAFEHVHLPIFDQQTTSDGEMERVADLVCARIRSGKVVYVHCMGGHGRSGVLVSLVLARLYGLSGLAAVTLCERCHSDRLMCKEAPGVFCSPETHEQRDQVFRVIDAKKPRPVARK